MREACFCGAMGENFGEEMASEDASRVLERRILLTMYEVLLVTPLNHVHQDLAEKASRGTMTDTDVQWGGGVPNWPSLHVEGCSYMFGKSANSSILFS